MSFKQKNNLFGWGVFLISLLTYTLTIEPTMSLWDCGEFLVSACKLEVSHAPGAPMFMLIGRIFSLFSFGQPEKMAVMVNMLSAVSAAATVMFLFWTLIWLTERYLSGQHPVIWFAAGIGALSFAFTDSFWFSAVEAEVYSMSSLFTAAVFWAATRWEREAGEPFANRWMVLIFFLTGLSIGVHLLNLLVIPGIALIIFFRRYPWSLGGFLLTLTASFALVLLLMNIYIPGFFVLAGPLELFAVNKLGLPVNAGFYIYLALTGFLLSWLIRYFHVNKKPVLYLCTLCLLFLTLGYSSYLAVFIRSAANPPVDQGNPETPFSLISYLKRESYGTRPFLYGENFGSVVKGYEERYTYVAGDNGYVPVELNPELNYYPGMTGFFPRMHSKDPGHIEAYRQWTSMKGRKVNYRDGNGVRRAAVLPTFGENLEFFLKYQLGHMYFRYFMWNFAGRQNDIQGFGGPLHGNWISGIPFLDALRLGPQKKLPEELLLNKGRNRYFLLPLVLSLTGLFYHYRKEKKSFSVLLLLFLTMGMGLVVYLNEVPDTPRERDYVYVGSFYVFTVWIGVGVIAFFRFLQRWVGDKAALPFSVLLGILAGPAILLQQNYDDHDRSDRYTGRDLARNYLMACEPDAILFTHADNDTYPLWYCQEVEGIRRDVRVVVMPYLAANWYLRQISRTIYANRGVKLTVPLSRYETGEVNYLPVVPRIDAEQDMRDVLGFVASDSSKARVQLQSGEMISYIPVKDAWILLNGERIKVDLDKRYLGGDELAFWDIVASNAGDRPLCFTSWADAESYGLRDHLRFDGLVYTLAGETHRPENPVEIGQIDPARLYDILMVRCWWENMKDPDVYFDWHHRRMFAVAQIRYAFYRLAESLIRNGRPKQALKVVQEAMAVVPLRHWPVDYSSCLLNELWLVLDGDGGGKALLREQVQNLDGWLKYLFRFEGALSAQVEQECSSKAALYRELARLAVQHDPELAKIMEQTR